MWTESPHSDIPNIETITNLEPSAIRHFYDKLLKLKDLMHTETGRKLARERHAFMEQFLNQFYKEWHIYKKGALRQIGLMSPNIEIKQP